MKGFLGVILIVVIINTKVTVVENLGGFFEESIKNIGQHVKQNIDNVGGLILNNRPHANNEAATTNNIAASNPNVDASKTHHIDSNDNQGYELNSTGQTVHYANNLKYNDDYTETNNKSNNSIKGSGYEIHQGTVDINNDQNKDGAYEKIVESEHEIEYGKDKSQSETSSVVDKTSAIKVDEPYVAPAIRGKESERALFNVPCTAGMGRAVDGSCVKSMGN